MKKLIFLLLSLFTLTVNAQHIRVGQIKSTGETAGKIVTSDVDGKLVISGTNASNLWTKSEFDAADTTRWGSSSLNGYKLNSDSVDADGYTRRDRLASQISTRVAKNANITPSTNTKITYDAKGLVTGSATATASDIANIPYGSITTTTVQGALNGLDNTKVPTTRTLTINGTTYDLSTDRSWTISGAAHDPVSLGTANGLSLSTQQLSMSLASGTTTGTLSPSDWNTFNNKLSSYTETDPVVKAISGIVKSNGSTISAAVAGTDYLTPTGSAASLTNFPILNQNTTGTASNITGIVLGANGGTGVANTGKTITLGGSLVTVGGYTTTITMTTNTTVTLPATGTLMANLVEDTTPDLGGNMTLNQKNIDMSATLSTNSSYSGLIESGTVGETVAFGDVLYLKFSDGKWWKAKADAYATTPGLRMAMASISANASGVLLIEGNVRYDSWSLADRNVWLSAATAGAITTTQPSTTGNQIQYLGVAKTSTTIYFKPSSDVGEK